MVWPLSTCTYVIIKKFIFLKLDFEKAFDKIEHQAMLDIMKHKKVLEIIG